MASPSPSGLPAARLDPDSDRDPKEAARELAGLLARGSRLRLWAWDPEGTRVERAHWIRSVPGAAPRTVEAETAG